MIWFDFPVSDGSGSHLKPSIRETTATRLGAEGGLFDHRHYNAEN
jgi:hypothetical protein